MFVPELEVQYYAYRIINGVETFGKKIANGFRIMMDSLIEARMLSAQAEVAKMLHLTEFRHETFDYVFKMVREGRIEEMRK